MIERLFPLQYAQNEELLLKDSSIMGQLPLTAIFTSFFFWANVYFYLSIFNRNCSPEWNCRIITLAHGVVVTFLCFCCVFITGPWPFTYIAQPNTPFHTAIIIISIGYFIFDLMWCIWYQTEGPVMMAHHCVSLVGLTYGLYTGTYGCELVSMIGGSESSNPFLQTRWFLKESNMYYGIVEKLIDYGFVAIFIFLRLGVGSVYHYFVQSYPGGIALVPMVGGWAFYIISVIFGVQILGFFVKKHVLKRRRPSEALESDGKVD